MTNIKFEYLFRDENNYKEYGEVIFSNPKHLSLEIIKKNITDNLIEGSWFYPDSWRIPKFSFHSVSIFGYNDCLWYEFIDVSKTKKEKNNITLIDEFLKRIDKNKTLGFSVKSQLGRPSTLLNASGATNFTYLIKGKQLSEDQIEEIHNLKKYSDKISRIKEFGSSLIFDKVEHPIFESNLQTIDFNFDKILAEILLLYYTNDISSENTIHKFIEKITTTNSIGYNLEVNSSIYELIMKKFLTDYALGMRAAEVWKRDYQATGGYLVVRKDGELICYHFYFAKSFEEYLFRNTKLETPDRKKHSFGNIYTENGIQKIKLNLQIRFIK
ncbi:HpaII family restriction endonuclease [Ancylomarina euxinus]|uniref:HpaII family restriction endonuclease n=1 Tax=Ancylomarina euxinus TaxID=2283627 RepID=A0A425Y8U2_9BACT|nr:HpaII family restriction endonuclease [Ancylomarina euxinus]MCZ4693374.1 HpaII family restriction endonuclease [Ancylomarina euxinus]MUP13602.1 HpaII family restriction endonuclease [Ancylomarina euxinus]RRG24752.1 HpaII family restriction endonuclease [Ancylomarina euxinus]